MKAIQLVGAGVSTSGNNPATLTPGAITYATGDLVLIIAGSRAVSTVKVAQPLGWRQLAQLSGMSILGRIMGSRLDGVGDSMPVIKFIGGAAGDDAMVASYVFRYTADDVMAAIDSISALQSNAAAQNIACPALTTTTDGAVVISAAVKQDDLTSFSKPGETALTSSVSTAGNDAAMLMLATIKATAGVHAAGTITVTGGAAAASWAFLAAIKPYVTSLPYPKLADSPCDMFDEMVSSMTTLLQMLFSVEDDIAGISKKSVYRFSSTGTSMPQSSPYIQWNSVDIDPNGEVDIIGDPDSIILSDGLWLTGTYAATGFSGTAGNIVSVRAPDAVNGSQSVMYGAGGKPPSGGSSSNFSAYEESIAGFRLYTMVSATGSAVPAMQDIAKAVGYAIRISD